jgi:signal transduction histidine kinase
MKSYPKSLLAMSLLWPTVLLFLGGWWLYLMSNIDTILVHLDKFAFKKMLFWEGSAFIILLFLISTSMFFMHIKDQIKTKSLHDFFSSLTHELKTPLASIKLQAEVLGELMDQNNDDLAFKKNQTQIKKLLNRLTSDSIKLETQMDKILQLSRLERGGEMNLSSIKLLPFVKSIHRNWKNDFELELNTSNDEIEILADEFALGLIFKNLFENTKNHSNNRLVKISLEHHNSQINILYNDGGIFEGEFNKLSSLFYKHNSTKGSGIGLYLIKKMALKMNGNFTIINARPIQFLLTLKKSVPMDKEELC